MPSNSKTAVQIAGINSYPNPLGPSMPAGSTLQADNLRTDHPGSLTPRPGQSPLERFGDPSGAAINVTSWLTGVKNWNWLYQLGDGLYPSWLDAGNLWQVLSTNVTDGTHLTISTASAAVYGVDQELFTNVVNTPTARGINWATDQYINLKNGVARLHVLNSLGEVRTAGLPQAAPPIVMVQDPIVLSNTGSTITYNTGTTYALPLNGSALEDLESAAYQLLYMRTDYDATILLGPPSAQVAATNSFYTGSAVFNAPVVSYFGSTVQNITGTSTPTNRYCPTAVMWEPATGKVLYGVFQTASTSPNLQFVATPFPVANALVPVVGSSYEIAAIYATPSAVSSTTSNTTTVWSTPVASYSPGTTAIPIIDYLGYDTTGSTGFAPPPNCNFSNASTFIFQNLNTSKTAAQQTTLNNAFGPFQYKFSPGQFVWVTDTGFPSVSAFVQGLPLYLAIGGGFTVTSTNTVAQNPTFITTNPPAQNSAPVSGDLLTLIDSFQSSVSATILSGTISGTTSTLTVTTSIAAADLFPSDVIFDPIALGSNQASYPAFSWDTTETPSAIIAAWAAFCAITTQATWHGPRNVVLALPFDQWLAYQAYNARSSAYEAYSYQLYRSVNNPTVSSDGTVPQANTQAALVSQALLPTNAQQGTTYYIPYFDQTPITALGAALYTDPTQEGALQANYPPPPCADLTLFNNIALFANIAQPANMQIQLVGVTSIVGTSSLPSMQPGDTFTVSYTPTTSGDSGVLTTTLTAITSTATLSSGQFQLVTSSGVSANLNQTVKNICNELVAQGLFSQRSGGVIAWPDTAANGEPGLFTLAVTQGLGSITLSYASSHTAGPSANLLTPNQATCGDQLGNTTGFLPLSQGEASYNTPAVAGYTLSTVTTVPWGAPFQGTNAIHWVSATNNYEDGVGLQMPCAANTTYVVSGRYGSVGTQHFSVNLNDNSGLGGTGADNAYPSANTWQYFTQSFHTGPGATMLQLQINRRFVVNTPDFYLDALQIQTGSVATAWAPPAGTITDGHPSPFVGIPASGTAGPRA